MSIKASIIADSINEFGDRITSFVLTYPRIIHAEVMTHRMFSRNAASSRAIPSEKLLRIVKENPFIPIAFQKAHSGMQGFEYMNEEETNQAIKLWLKGRDNAVENCNEQISLGITKQLTNRPLETYQYYTALVTATNFENFFYLRCPQYKVQCMAGEVRYYRSKKDAIRSAEMDIPFDIKKATDLDWLKINSGQGEIHIMALAEAMWDAKNESIPKQLKAGEWHIPFGDNIDEGKLWELINSWEQDRHLEPADVYYGTNKKGFEEAKMKIATARCARISYALPGEEGKADNYANDIKLHDRLAASGHWSPFEHCAQAMSHEERLQNLRGKANWEEAGGGFSGLAVTEDMRGWSGNFRGFIQYRKMFDGENKTVYGK